MIHIVKVKKGYMVASIAANGEVLQTSETLSSKRKCWQNIRALLNDCFVSLAAHLWPGILVQDDTVNSSKVWVVQEKSKTVPDQSVKEKVYKPKAIK